MTDPRPLWQRIADDRRIVLTVPSVVGSWPSRQRADLPPRGWLERQTAPMPAVCSCGVREVHEVARRQTADDRTVSLDSEGQVWLGRQMPVAVGRRLPEMAARLVVDSAGWYSAEEIPALVSAARWVVSHCWRGHESAMARRVGKHRREA